VERIHTRCGEDVTFNKHEVTEGYFCACLHCDEDLFEFETKEIK